MIAATVYVSSNCELSSHHAVWWAVTRRTLKNHRTVKIGGWALTQGWALARDNTIIVGIVCEGGNLGKQSCEKVAKCLLEVYKYCVQGGASITECKDPHCTC